MKRKGLFKFCSILYCISILLNSLMPITAIAADNEYLNTTEEVESSETVASNEETNTTTSEEVNFEIQKNTTEENLGVYEFDSNVLKTRMFSNEFVPINTLSQSKGNTRETQKAVYVGENNTGTTDGSQEHPYTTLEDARRSLPNQSGIIYLLKDITLTTNFYIGGTGSLTIASADSKNVHTISRDSSYKGVILQISGDSTVSKEVNLQNIIIDGRGDNVSSPLINVKPKLNLNILSGAVLRNNKTTANGGAVYSNDANIVLNGGEISSNISNRGSAIMADGGSVTLTSGTIHSNTASENGGAILMNNGTVSIDGVEIYSNIAKEGGALVLNSGSLTMNAGDSTGQIYLNNASERGGAIFLNNSKFTMEGGNVYSNNAMFINKNLSTGKGGAVFASNDSTVTMNAGSFYSNDAGTCGGAMNFIDSTFTMNGGVIRDNVAHQQAGAVSLYGKSSATISAGTIKNNELAITKEINELTQSDKAIGMAYGAGGVYVDKQSKLHLTNVIIHENIANEAIQSSTFVSGPFAGGISLCPTSQAYFYLTNGGAIYDNGQIDVTATPQSEFWNTGTPRLFVSDYALGGAEYNWTDENGNPVNARDIIVNENVTKKVYLTSGIDPSYNPSHSVEFVGNETNSVYGGGAIACNGTLVIGTPGDLSVTKIVDGWATEKTLIQSLILK